MSSTKRTPMQDIPCDKRVTGVAKGKILYLRRDGEGSPGKSCDCFLIRDDGHHGGSCVCYTATLLGEEKTGRLKEFYPMDMEALTMLARRISYENAKKILEE